MLSSLATISVARANVTIAAQRVDSRCPIVVPTSGSGVASLRLTVPITAGDTSVLPDSNEDATERHHINDRGKEAVEYTKTKGQVRTRTQSVITSKCKAWSILMP